MSTIGTIEEIRAERAWKEMVEAMLSGPKISAEQVRGEPNSWDRHMAAVNQQREEQRSLDASRYHTREITREQKRQALIARQNGRHA